MNQSRNVSHGFPEKLSYDIIYNIFLYLDQQDCLNCMATCRLWYALIPSLTQANWKILRLNKRGISQLQERNLGKHVKHILFNRVDEDSLSKMMEKLLDCGCTEIESLEFNHCLTGTTEVQQTVFLNLLRRTASHQLTHLALTYYNWNFSILDLLFVCPHLTHFLYHANVFSDRKRYYKSIKLLPSNQSSYNALIYLHMDALSNISKKQTQYIIHRSPNLRYFIGANNTSYNAESRILIPPELVLLWCPKLEYYSGDGSCCENKEVISETLRQSTVSTLVPILATNNNSSSNNNERQQNEEQQQNHTPLQYFAVKDKGNVTHTSSLLRKYKNTLKHLRLTTYAYEYVDNPSGWTHAFQTIPLQQLRTLYLNDLHYSKESLITLLNTCRDTIQEFHLQRSVKHQILDIPMLQRLQTLPQLRTLSLQRVKFEDEPSVLTLLERLPSLENLTFENWAPFILPEQAAPLLKNLKSLHFVYTRAEFDDHAIPISTGLFLSLSKCGSKLETLSMMDLTFKVPFRTLIALATLPSLKSLCVNIVDYYTNVVPNGEEEEQRLQKFIKTLLRERDNNNINNSNITTVSTTAVTTIENLTFHHVYKLTYSLLNVLGDLTNLQNVYISLFEPYRGFWDHIRLLATSDDACFNLDLCGVVELLRKGRKLKKVVIRGMISSGNHIPLDYLKTNLLEKQQSNLQLRKYIVKSIYHRRLKKTGRLFESDLEIINIHYK